MDITLLDFILISLIVGMLINTLVFFIFKMFSCGGRDCCGSRFCLIGLYDDYPIFIIILVFIISFIVVLFRVGWI